MSILIYLFNKLLAITFFMSIFYVIYFTFKFVMHVIKNEKMIFKKNELFFLLVSLSNIASTFIVGLVV